MAEKKRPCEAVRRVLVVDDEPEVAEILRDYIVSDGYDADVALNGRDAVAQFERKRPDAVLLDIAMAGMDGVEVLRRLKALDANARWGLGAVSLQYAVGGDGTRVISYGGPLPGGVPTAGGYGVSISSYCTDTAVTSWP